MASPQLENGYLRLSNELAEALARTPLSGSQLRIILTIMRECFGRNGGQKLAQISARKVSTMTDLHIRSVRRELSRLFSAGILARSDDPTHRLYGIQKDYQKWDLKSWSLRSNVDGGADQSVTPDRSVTPGRSVLKSGPICPPMGSGPINREERRNISSKPSRSDKSVPTSGNGKGKIKATILCLWDYYIAKLEKNPKLLTLTALREQKGRSRFEECLRKTGGDLGKAQELMQMAIDALAASDFHRGGNESKKKYDSWEKNAFPSQEKLEWWLERAQC